MKVIVISTVICVLGTIPKGLIIGLEELEIEERTEIIKTTKYWDRQQYWEESWRLEETCGYLNSSENLSADASEKNSQKSKIIIKVKVKLATIVEDDSMAPFSIATSPGCREVHFSFKLTIARKYWKRTPSNKRRRRKKN